MLLYFVKISLGVREGYINCVKRMNRAISSQILGDMKELRVVSLMGNPVIKTIKMYRKTMILKCRNLNYLDDRPVFQRDRACTDAW